MSQAIDRAFCEALGFDPAGITSVTIKMQMGQPISFVTTGYIHPPRLELGSDCVLMQELKRYHLVLRDD